MGIWKRLFGKTEDKPIIPPLAPVSFVVDYTETNTELTETPAKRGRGRPRKTEAGGTQVKRDGGVLVKRGRGRPRKTEAGGTQLVAPVARAAAKKPKKKGGKKKGKGAY